MAPRSGLNWLEEGDGGFCWFCEELLFILLVEMEEDEDEDLLFLNCWDIPWCCFDDDDDEALLLLLPIKKF